MTDSDNKLLLEDRIQKIRQVIEQYGEENFYISFSGGKDSTVLSALVDMALPGNRIPRVYADTGIELNMIRDFVLDTAKTDDRVIIIKPSVPIKRTLEEVGYPFKSKRHARYVDRYNRLGRCNGVLQYLGERKDKEAYSSRLSCPKILRYQFEPGCKLHISDNCCKKLKEDPMKQWQKENKKSYAIIGVMRAEGGNRDRAQCMAFARGRLKAFQPLAIVPESWEEWFIGEYNIRICGIYHAPYNFARTGCKGCPFAIGLQHELDVLEEFFPAERKQCEAIWEPVYDEYRRLGYRLTDTRKQEE